MRNRVTMAASGFRNRGLARSGLAILMLVLAGCSLLNPHHPSKPPPMPIVYLVFFHPLSAELTPEGRVIVDQAAQKVKDMGPSTVTLAGYTDAIGTPQGRIELADRRIQTVQQVMVADGIDPKLFLRIPIGPSEYSVGQTGDRRIEIRLQFGS